LLGKEDEETDSVYIIYTDYSSKDNGGGRSGDFTKQAKYYADLLGCSDKHMFSIKTVDDFIDVWNNRIGESADIVYVFSHGNGMSLIFLEGKGISATGYNRKGEKIDAIGNLHHKSIHKLYLMSCNSGHKDLYFEKGTNVAAVFVRLGGIDEVYAFNGSMSYYRIFSRKARLLWTQSGYYEVYENFELSSPVSNPSGWVKYIMK
jgi:hypothetical protein